jgi:hypothetical protein
MGRGKGTLLTPSSRLTSRWTRAVFELVWRKKEEKGKKRRNGQGDEMALEDLGTVSRENEKAESG